MSRKLKISVGDTRLYAEDSPGGTPALLFLSGGFGTVRDWGRVVRRLDGRYRTIRFDARGRGKSGRSADYSVEAAVDDTGRVIDATGIERPILVGWSHGATIAVRYAARHSERVGGLVLVDGAYPIAMFDESGKEKVRAQFRRLGWIMRIMALFGRSARTSPAESANVVIEMDAVNGELGRDFAALRCPTVFVVGTGAHSGATEDEMRTVRAAVADAERASERVSVFATTPTSTRRSSARTPRPWSRRSRTSSAGLRRPAANLSGRKPGVEGAEGQVQAIRPSNTGVSAPASSLRGIPQVRGLPPWRGSGQSSAA